VNLDHTHRALKRSFPRINAEAPTTILRTTLRLLGVVVVSWVPTMYVAELNSKWHFVVPHCGE
jgi:hypothetical protein